MANLAIIEKLEGISVQPKSRFMVALAQSMPQGCGLLPPALLRGALTAIKASEALQKCSEYSLFTSIAEVAQSGLSLDLHLGQCFLVPFSGQATVMYGYRGLCELARRSGEIDDIVGEIRYSKDKWSISLGSRRELVHIPLDAPPSKRGEILGAYAIAEMRHGRTAFEYMTIEEIDRIKNAVIKRKRGDKPIPWEINGAMEEMIRKTPIRRLGKRLPQSPSLIPFVQASIRDEYRQSGVNPVIDMGVAVESAIEATAPNHEPPKEPERKSEVREQKQPPDAKISRNEAADVYTLIADRKIESTEVPKLLASVGHKGKLAELPKAKLAALLAKIGEASA